LRRLLLVGLALLLVGLALPARAGELQGKAGPRAWIARARAGLGSTLAHLRRPWRAPARPAATAPRPFSARAIPIGSDHAGFALKEQLKKDLVRLGYRPRDMGTHSADSVDYPDFAHKVAGAVSAGKAQCGVLVCGTGIGMSMAANRHPGVRAAVVWSPEIAEATRRHNDANVLALPARHLTDGQASAILERFLATPFEGGRHQRRIDKIEPPR
jgi:ribose 5-phosphate isomerase B